MSYRTDSPERDAIVHINKLDSNTDCDKCIYCNGKGWRYVRKNNVLGGFVKCEGCSGFGYV